MEPGLHPREATQRKSPALGLSAARWGQLCSCYSNMVSTWAKLPGHLFNTQTPHGAPICQKAKGSNKHLMWGRFPQLVLLMCSFFFYSVITHKSLKVAPDRRVKVHGFTTDMMFWGLAIVISWFLAIQPWVDLIPKTVLDPETNLQPHTGIIPNGTSCLNEFERGSICITGS